MAASARRCSGAVNVLMRIAEQKIQEAIDRGELDNLPSAGRRLVLDDDALVPAELRAGYRLLKNAGYVPAELALTRELGAARQLVEAALTPSEHRLAYLRLESVKQRLEASRGRPLSPVLEEAYYRQLMARLESSPSGTAGDTGDP
jgi:hypothetical protein